jgi:hypothetical protein
MSASNSTIAVPFRSSIRCIASRSPARLPGRRDRIRTRQLDFPLSGSAWREVVCDAAGKILMLGKGKRQRPKARIVSTDADGRVAGPQCLWATLGTALARAGVAPQLARKIMRHSDDRTNLKHCTVFGPADTASALAAVEVRTLPRRLAATGTADPATDEDIQHPDQSPNQLGHCSLRSDATA